MSNLHIERQRVPSLSLVILGNLTVTYGELIDINDLSRHIRRIMNITQQATDEAVLSELGGRLAQVRLERNLTQAQLAGQAGVSKRTVERLESGAVATQLSGFIRVCRALNLIERFDLLIPETAPSPMAQLRLRGRKRRRASATKAVAKAVKASSAKWTWKDKP